MVVAAGLVALSAVALLGVAVLPPVRHRLFPRDLAAHAAWNASTAFPGSPDSGIGPSSSSMPFFVHTASEAHPWVEIHLQRPARIREIRVENRSDCCTERTMPLDVEIPDGVGGWDLICQRHARFSSWTCHPWHPVHAQTIRLSLPSSGMLHLRKVSVYE